MPLSGEPVRPLRLGLVGLGGATTLMLPTLTRHPGIRIVAGTDSRPDARERFMRDFGAPAYETADQLCAANEVEAVYIATPHRFHAQHAIAAAEHRKHIIVEKPMALTLAECDAMITACEHNGVHLIVGHTHGFDAPILKIREIVRTGELGPLAMINTWAYNDYLYRPRWPEELKTELGGGIIFNQVPHQVEIVRLIGGGLARSVRSMAWVLDPARATEGSHVTFLQFADGSAASMVFSGYDQFDSDEFHFWIDESGREKRPGAHGRTREAYLATGGSEAEHALKRSRAYGLDRGIDTLRGSDAAQVHHGHFGVTIVTCAKGDLRPSADGVLIYGDNGLVEIRVDPAKAFPDRSGVVDELIESIARDQPPLHNGRWGKATLEVCLAMLVSARERREVTLSFQVADQNG
jgi:phthalate 4,5-cis-dihydrodiol dehydrogenase